MVFILSQKRFLLLLRRIAIETKNKIKLRQLYISCSLYLYLNQYLSLKLISELNSVRFYIHSKTLKMSYNETEKFLMYHTVIKVNMLLNFHDISTVNIQFSFPCKLYSRILPCVSSVTLSVDLFIPNTYIFVYFSSSSEEMLLSSGALVLRLPLALHISFSQLIGQNKLRFTITIFDQQNYFADFPGFF